MGAARAGDAVAIMAASPMIERFKRQNRDMTVLLAWPKGRPAPNLIRDCGDKKYRNAGVTEF
jgi:hypothetical protein